jgi:hypothetical protein
VEAPDLAQIPTLNITAAMIPADLGMIYGLYKADLNSRKASTPKNRSDNRYEPEIVSGSSFYILSKTLPCSSGVG